MREGIARERFQHDRFQSEVNETDERLLPRASSFVFRRPIAGTRTPRRPAGVPARVMNTRESFITEEADSGQDFQTGEAMIDLASLLEDFLDEEVVDKAGTAIGTLACYWQSINGLLVFLGVRLKGQESIRVVPGRRSQVDHRHACIRLGFDAVDIEAAPCFDCARELDAALERTVYDHFCVAEPQPRGGLTDFARPSKALCATTVHADSKAGSEGSPEARGS